MKLSEEVKGHQVNVDALKAELKRKENELLDMDESLAKVADMLEFISSNNLKHEEGAAVDYYQEMENRIEAKRDFFIVETCMQFMCEAVEQRRDDERLAKVREAIANGEDVAAVEKEYKLEAGNVENWLMTEVRTQQSLIINGDEKKGIAPRSLGYDIEPVPDTISWEETQSIIDMIVLRVTGNLNEKYNDMASSLVWYTLKGKRFDTRFLYLYAWKFWENEGLEAKESKACQAWEDIFHTPEECAKMSIEAKVNTRMSDVAREQGRIWGYRHPMETAVAERLLSEAFEQEFTTERARTALDIRSDPQGSMPPATKALAIAWLRLHPEEVSAAKDEINAGLAEEFKRQFGDKCGEIAVKIFNNFAEDDEIAWANHAEHWRSFNADLYQERQNKFIDEQRDEFVAEFPNFTAMEAAGVLENAAVAKLVTDPEVAEELAVPADLFMRATCWGLRNQGLLRAARAQVNAKNEKKMAKLWPELEALTDGWRKGAYNNLTPAMIKDPKLDRFLPFRERLLNKFAWVYGHLNRLYIELFEEIESFDSKDPMGKILHNIRPTTFEKYKRNIEDSFLKHKKYIESTVTDVVAKLSLWNTYFGISSGGAETELGYENDGAYTAEEAPVGSDIANIAEASAD